METSEFRNLLRDKWTGIVARTVDVFRLLPLRMYRFSKHLIGVVHFFKYGQLKGDDPEFNNGLAFNMGLWCLEFNVYILEIFGIGEIYETTVDLLKFNTRKMYNWEIEVAKSVFGDHIRYDKVRIDERAHIGAKKHRFAYVSFYTINSWGPISRSHLIHELMHVWQYEELGAVYMPKAAAAQQSPRGYNYGGLEKLEEFRSANKNIRDFNLEQQGDVVQDYFLLKQGHRPQWARQAQPADLCLFEYFIDHLEK